MQWLGSIVFTVFLFVWMLFFGIAYCVITPFLSFKGRFWMAGVMTHVVFFALRVFCGLKYSVEGRENLPAGNHVILMKHSSTWETFAIMILFPPLVWVMKREILWIPFVGWGCMLARCIAIDRKAGTAAVNQVLAQGKDRLESARRVDPRVSRRHAHGAGRNAQVRIQRHVVSRAGEPAHRAGGAQLRLFLAAPRTARRSAARSAS